VNRAIVCGDCGYVMLFASPDALQKARESWGQLLPARP
jgi:hypothetical protein